MAGLATCALVVYQYHGLPATVPPWFLLAASRFTGIRDVEFHLHGWGHLCLRAAEASPGLFFLYEPFYLVKWTSWEFFFRGFMLFGFLREFGSRAVLVSTIPFTLIHFGKPELEMFSAFPAGLILCFIALRAKSIWPGVFPHSMVAFTMDFFSAGWWM